MRLALWLLLAALAFPAAPAQTPTIDVLASPNAGTNGFFGGSVAAVPDLTGDGRPELLVGASGEAVAGFTGAGCVYLFSTSGLVVAR